MPFSAVRKLREQERIRNEKQSEKNRLDKETRHDESQEE